VLCPPSHEVTPFDRPLQLKLTIEHYSEPPTFQPGKQATGRGCLLVFIVRRLLSCCRSGKLASAEHLAGAQEADARRLTDGDTPV
jgi:hypothetical protein